MRVSFLVPAACLLSAAAGAAEIRVRFAEGAVDVRAEAALLADILKALSRETGMAVIYEGQVPSRILTTTLKGRTPAEAVVALLEGQGLNYALRMDATGTRVDSLLMVGVVGLTREPPSTPLFGTGVVPPPPPSAVPAVDPALLEAEEPAPEPEPLPEAQPPHPEAPPKS